jgi:lysine-specific demethylase 3
MYMAYKDKARYGSTRIHMDVADALNLMVFASNNGFAIWHIFRRQDAELLAQFMGERFKRNGNMILQQMIYLSDDDLAELWHTYRIRPYVIYQRAGDMVFIPAGCPHQVSLITLIQDNFRYIYFILGQQSS